MTKEINELEMVRDTLADIYMGHAKSKKNEADFLSAIHNTIVGLENEIAILQVHAAEVN